MHYYLYGLLGVSSLFLVYTSVTPKATAMVLLYRFIVFLYTMYSLFLIYILLLGQL